LLKLWLMMPSARSLAPLGSGLTALALVLTFARVASADECAADSDCGHGFSCETMVVSGTGGSAGAAGSGSGGSTAGTGSGFAPPATGGTGTSGSAGTGSAGTGSGGTGSEIPVPVDYCGDGLCQTLSESVDTCPEDCSNYRYCAPSDCMSAVDCADGYVCVGQTRPGTGGVGGASGMGGTSSGGEAGTSGTAGTSGMGDAAGTGSGAAALICGDGFCTSPENATE
jgi:hypothetical protein